MLKRKIIQLHEYSTFSSQILIYTMLYCLIFLQATICTGNVNPGYDACDEDRINSLKIQTKSNEGSQSEKKSIEELYNYMQNTSQNNVKLEKLYNAIVDESLNFLCSYCSMDSKNVHFEAKHSYYYESNYTKSFCTQVKQKFMKEIEYKDTKIDSAFDCAYNMFVDVSTFAMDTFNIIYDLYVTSADTEHFYKVLYNNAELLENYILSINWIVKIKEKEPNYSLLHNLHKINTDGYRKKDYHIVAFYYEYDYTKTRIYREKYKTLENTIINHYNEKEYRSNEEIFLFENRHKFIKELKKIYLNEHSIKFHGVAEFASNAIGLKRGLKTKIEFIAKSNYYKDREENVQKFKLSEAQEKFLSDLQNGVKHEIKYEMNFEVLHMHSTYNILNICLLAIELDYNIKQLAVFTDKFVDDLMECIKKKHIKAINNYFDDLEIENEKQQALIKDSINSSIDKINAITSPTQDSTNTENKSTYKNIDFEKYYNNEYIPILDRLEKHNDNANCLEIQIQKLKLETQEMLKKTNDMKLEKKVSDIVELQTENNQNMENIEFWKAYSFKKALENNILFNNFKLACESDQPEQEINEVEKLITFISLKDLSLKASTRYLAKFIKNNKPKITKILKNTVELKGKIMEAEQEATDLIGIIKFYNNDDKKQSYIIKKIMKHTIQ